MLPRVVYAMMPLLVLLLAVSAAGAPGGKPPLPQAGQQEGLQGERSGDHGQEPPAKRQCTGR